MEDHAYAGLTHMCQIIRPHIVYAHTLEFHISAIYATIFCKYSKYRFKGSRLAAATLSYESDPLPLFDREANTVQHIAT